MSAIGRLLRGKKTKPEPMNKKVLIFLVIGILGSVIFLRFFAWTKQADRSLLPQISTLSIFEDPTTIANLGLLPTKTFGAELSIAGLYTQATQEFPQGTIALVYTKNDYRFIEIDYLPARTAEEYLATHIYPTQEIILDPDHSVWMLSIDDRPRCIDYEDNVANLCEISRHLIADLPDHLLLIAADGDHPTDGELIEIARSLIQQ